MIKQLSLCLLSILLVWSCKVSSKTQGQVSTDQIINAEAKMRIDTLFKNLVNSNNVGGISTLIFEDGKEVFYEAVGHQNREKDLAMARNTLVQIWSMTKPLVGTALMTLYEDGLFQLDDPLEKYLPEYANMKVFKGVDNKGNFILEDAKRSITIRDITRHTAGFVNNSQMEGLGPLVAKADLMNKNSSLTEMSAKLGKLPLMFHPGEQWSYGRSVSVQAALVEKLSGKSIFDYLKSEVLDPLGMQQTRYYVPPADQNRLSAVYFRSGEGQLEQQPDSSALDYNTHPYTMTPGGYGLTATIDDYMIFARMLQNEGSLNGVTILKPETIKLMATNALDNSVTERMWLPTRGQVGFGIDFAVRLAPPIDAAENNGVVGEFFWDGAASTLFWVDPVNDLTVVMFVQLFPYDQIKLHKRFRDAVYGPYDEMKIK